MFAELLTWMAGLPRWQMYAALLAFALVRGLGYYVSGLLGASRMTGRRWSEARERVRAVGARSVVVTWPVYGLAAATQVACGAARIPVGRFLLALGPLAVLWALLQTLVGVALIEALAGRVAPYLLGVVVVAVMVRAVLGRRRRAVTSCG